MSAGENVGTAVTNAGFLAEVFAGIDWNAERLHVCGFVGEPGKGASWGGSRYGGDAAELPNVNQNTYYSIASYRAGTAGRKKDNAAAVYVVTLDDVKDAPLSPSYQLQTGPESYQAGYLLAEPCSDIARMARLHEALAESGRLKVDTSGNNVVRYVRLPQGQNMKAKYGTPFTHVLHAWQPDVRYTVEQLEHAFGAKPQEAGTSTDDPKDTGPTDVETLTERVLQGVGLHEALNRLAASLRSSGATEQFVIRFLRGLMKRSTAKTDDPERWAERYADIPRTVRTATKFAPNKDTASAASVAELMAQEFPPLTWIVDGLIPEGTVLLAGKPKSGKSWLVLNIMVAAKLQYELLRHSVAACDGLYLALEDTPRRMQARMRTLMIDCPNRIKELAGFEYRCDWPRGTDGAAMLAEYLDAHPNCRIVAVDVLAKIRPVGDKRGAYEQDYEAIAAWKMVADARRITLIIVHHTRKAIADDVFDEVSGTLGINGAVDQIIVLKRLPANPKQATLHMRGRDLPDDHELGIELRVGWWHLVGKAADLAASDARKEVLEVLRDSDQPMSTADLMKATGKRSRTSFLALLNRMVEAGQIKRVGRRYAVDEGD